MLIQTKRLIKNYSNGNRITKVLRGIDLAIKEGDFVGISGRSGAGKSTLLYQLSLLDEPTGGEVIVDGVKSTDLSNGERTKFRLNKLGYVFQDYAILPELTARENVMIPILMRGKSEEEAARQADKALTQVGLQDRIKNLPSALSGGEQQRVSIARAIVNKPKILFADEPTANLDSETAEKIMKIFSQLHKNGQTIVMVTHESEALSTAKRIVKISDGQIINEEGLRYLSAQISN
jgi:ABC-type antimicrobial peptide transport system, ATPase component